MRYLVDSSLYVSSLDEMDSNYSLSSAVVSLVQQHVIITPTLVVAEVINVIAKIHPSIVKTVYRNLLQNEIVNLDDSFLKSYVRRFPLPIAIKTSDLIIAITAATTKSTLLTWDKQLLTFAGSICSVVNPRTLLKMSGLK